MAAFKRASGHRRQVPGDRDAAFPLDERLYFGVARGGKVVEQHRGDVCVGPVACKASDLCGNGGRHPPAGDDEQDGRTGRAGDGVGRRVGRNRNPVVIAHRALDEGDIRVFSALRKQAARRIPVGKKEVEVGGIGRADALPVEHRVDVVGPALEGGRPSAASGQRAQQRAGDRRFAAAARGRGDQQARKPDRHSLPPALRTHTGFWACIMW